MRDDMPMTSGSNLLRRSILLVGASLVTLSVASAAAAQTSGADAGESSVDEVIVTARPIVGSQKAALQRQRQADNIVNAIAADTVGQFPDQNAAAALSRLPAVAVQRDQGQERYLQIRGAPNRWTSVSIDGINVIGVDESGLQRAFRFDAVPAVMLSALEVNKSLTPDLSAEAVVARVDLQTFSAFDRRGLATQGGFGQGEMDLGGGLQEEYSLRGSWSGDQFGVLAAISHYSREQVTDNRETTYDAISGLPTALDFRNYLVERESNGAIAGLEWRPADGHSLSLKTIFTEFNDNEQRNQYVVQVGSGIGVRTAESGDLVGVPIRGTANNGFYENSNQISTLGGDHELGAWKLDWRVNYTETDNSTDLPILLSQQLSSSQRFAVRYNRSSPNFPILDIASQVPGAAPGTFVRGTGLTNFNPASFGLNLLLPLSARTQSESWIYKADASREVEFAGQAVELRMGAQFDEREVFGSILSGSAPIVALTQLFPAVGLTFNYANYLTDRSWDTGFPSGFDFKYLDNRAMRRDVDAGLKTLETAGLYFPERNISPTDRYDISERLAAAYGSAKLEIGNAQIVAGLRVEQMEQTISGFIRSGTTAAPVLTPLKVTNEDTSVFPSLNVRYELAQDTLARFAVMTGISRPGYGAIRSGASVSDIGLTVTGGNPQLEPEKTWGVDVAVERYLPGEGIVSASAFWRHVDKVLYDASSPVGSDIYDAPGIDRSGYTFTSTRNGDEGALYGLELAYQQQFVFLPSWLSGFGFQGNVTFLDGEFDTKDGRTSEFPGTSSTITNASLYYERYGLSARLSHQWRDDWIDTLNSLGSGEYRKAYESLDLSVRYAVTEGLTVYVDANNLTDEVYVAYEGNLSRPSEVEQVGKRWMVGLRFNY